MERSTPNVRLRDLFISFLKIGLFTFGGGYAMVPLIEREVVTRRGWIESSDFLNLLTLAQSVPGPIALNSAAFVGYNSRGYWGALVSVLAIIAPSFTLIMLIAIFFNSIRENEIVDAAFKAMRPVVIALIIAPMLSFMKGMKPLSIAIIIVTMALIVLLKISPAILIFGSGFGAVIYTYIGSKRYIKKREEGER